MLTKSCASSADERPLPVKRTLRVVRGINSVHEFTSATGYRYRKAHRDRGKRHRSDNGANEDAVGLINLDDLRKVATSVDAAAH